ncbi:MAG: hypothetical protein [Microviridae sp.]|nr:MAG: hypothetical protein [Microviridae sp.]
MLHTLKVNGYKFNIRLYVSVIDNETHEVVDEGFDSVRAASQLYPRSLFHFLWTAVGFMNQYGKFLQTPIYVYGATKDRAMSNLKNALK